jgi:hypothetical protein
MRAIHTEGMWSPKDNQCAHSHSGLTSCDGRTFDANLTRTCGQFFNHNDKTRVVIHFWSIMEGDEVQLCRQHLEVTLPILTSNWTWPRVAVKKYKIDTIVAGFWQRVKYQRYSGLSLLSDGIHVPSYNQWLRRYVLPKLTNAAGILS